MLYQYFLYIFCFFCWCLPVALFSAKNVAPSVSKRSLQEDLFGVRAFLEGTLNKSAHGCVSDITSRKSSIYHSNYTIHSEVTDLDFQKGVAHFKKNVALAYQKDNVLAQEVILHKDDHDGLMAWHAKNKVLWQRENMVAQAQNLHYVADKGYDALDVYALLFGLDNRRIWIRADHLQLTKDQWQLSDVLLSSCNPHNMAWHIQSPKVVWLESEEKIRLLRPQFYFFNVPLFRARYYDLSLSGEPSEWTPTAFLNTGSLQVGLLYRPKNSMVGYSPYLTSRKDVGFRLEHYKSIRSHLLRGYIDWMYHARNRQSYWKMFHQSAISLPSWDVSWQLQFKNTGQDVFNDQSSIRPNQSLASHIEAKSVGKPYDLSIGGYWFKRYAGNKWDIDQYGLPDYDRLPSVRYALHSRNGLRLASALDYLTFLTKEGSGYPSALRFLGYAGYEHESRRLLYGHAFRWQIGSWYKARYLGEDLSGLKRSRHNLLPRLELDWRLVNHSNYAFGIAYDWVPTWLQNGEPLFTQNRWFWRDVDQDVLNGMDRLMDKNDLKLYVKWPIVKSLPGWQGTWSHDIPLKKRSVYLSTAGEEDPQVAYRHKISKWTLSRYDNLFKLQGLWNWELLSWHAIQVQMQYKKLSVFYIEEPGVLLRKSGNDFFTRAKLFGLVLPLLQNKNSYGYLALHYQSNANKILYYKLGWEYKDCCMSFGLELSKKQVLTGKRVSRYSGPSFVVRLSAYGW